MRGAACGEMDLVIRGGAEGIIPGLQPLEAGEGKPTVRFQEIFNVLRAPSDEIFLPCRILREGGKGRAKPCDEDSSRQENSKSHGEL